MSFEVTQPGLLTLIQDSGRYGQHAIGLTTGGPLDPNAFDLCNRLLQNLANSTALEISFGGLALLAKVDTFLCLTGANMPLCINNVESPRWQVHPVSAGDTVAVDYAEAGCRSYLGVAGGFEISPSFGSTATVVREKLGGLSGDKLGVGDVLPCSQERQRALLYLPEAEQPCYPSAVTVRVIPGYQEQHFSQLQHRRFFSNSYTVSDRCDRMGYRLEGPAVQCELEGILSEGICYGAIQVPADGQPIVLLNDRQTIGGYPKIGSALSLDAAKMAQLTPGGLVDFSPISIHEAHNTLQLARSFSQRQQLSEKTS